MATEEDATEDQAEPKPAREAAQKPRRIIRRRRRNKGPEIDMALLEKTVQASSLPKAYSFELPKTVQRIQSIGAAHVALQMPEGLLMYATVLSDVIKRLCPTLTQVSILGDVTYGACCVDDLGAKALGAQLLVHYGHSCLVPIQHTAIPCLYVFVEITIDVPHLVDCLDMTLCGAPVSTSASTSADVDVPTNSDTSVETKPLVYLLGTIQFRHALLEADKLLQAKGYETKIPQAKPLSPGEVLGCTSPVLTSDRDSNAVVCFVADGRFHLESTLISNPHIPVFYRYDPYSKALTEEAYKHEEMKDIRHNAIQRARSAKTFGILLGTLGRQGNPAIVQRIKETLRAQGKRHFLMLVSEITPHKLALFHNIDAWVQVACPRLSVDWGHHLCEKPVLNPYELMVCLEKSEWRKVYPMDYYAQAGGEWANYHESNKNRVIEI